MREKLKPCPFCGGEAKIQSPDGLTVGGYSVKCKECEIEQSVSYMTLNEAIEAWNRRANHD